MNANTQARSPCAGSRHPGAESAQNEIAVSRL